MDNSLDETMQRQNLLRLLEALRGLPLHHVKVVYAGESGHVTYCKVSVSPMGTEHHLSAGTVEQVRPAVSHSSPEEALSPETLPLTQALQNFALHWAGLLDESWPRGDGGDGTMVIQIAEGLLTLDHDVVCIQNLHATLRSPS
ncbi:MAG: hypothetical protein Q8J78_09210 [Moraxellaceae bacterium]|nr:hypothetical protein [Moraxellaceae bacterium]